MSISRKFAEALMLTKTLKSRQLLRSDIPAIKAFHQSFVVQCRKCQGNSEGCVQCGGKGIEKLSLKAYNKELRKQQVAVKTAPAKEEQ